MTNLDKTKKSLKGDKSKRQTRKQRREMVDQLNPITEEDVSADWVSLCKFTKQEIKDASPSIRTGNKVVDYFTYEERLHTKANQHMDFYSFWRDREKFKKIKYIRNMLTFYESRDIAEIRKWKYIYNLYVSSVSIFRPVMSMEIYDKVQAKRVLDFTMGWGGRLVGACARNLEAYYGVDLNTHLETPYRNLVAFLQKQGTTTDIQLHFKDALLVDYSQMDYDTVMTSPPYYNIEVYRNQPLKTKTQWNEEFYKPILEKTWASLKIGGHYCLNVPVEVYENACIPVLGKCHMKMVLKKGRRTKTSKYVEYIYIWKKAK
jgi:16S rRNA G966 N2-methylase RsmD